VSQDVRIAVKGVMGRMGQRIAALLDETPGAVLTAATERAGAPAIGKDLGDLIGTGKGVRVLDNVTEALQAADVLIDFTVAPATLADVDAYGAGGKGVVIGTTGFENAEVARIRAALSKAPYVLAPNMSIGVNVLLNLVTQAAQALGEDYDVEVFEAHHKLKKDSPSGTAVALAERAAAALGRTYPEDAVFRNRGLIGERTSKEIGMQVMRGGDIVGDHTVFFAGMGERLELTHRASSRDTFARGAIRAALWLYGRPPGAYDMQDVLGLR
jgi:4-hydroxy-tetrahydrodipicolinate reductase